MKRLALDVKCTTPAMSTKTMRLPPRRKSTTNASSKSNTIKRKERESVLNAPHQSTIKTLRLSKSSEPISESVSASGQLLAGYLAREFVTKGTLLGQPWNPTTRSTKEQSVMSLPNHGSKRLQYDKLERYVEVANLLKSNEAHLAGIVNPTQLGTFLQF